jgi:hypothetical protein
MIVRIPQRTKDDCAICAVAMVMGSSYSYERVLFDSNKYSKITVDGKFLAWWELYLRDEGFESIYCRFNGLYALNQCKGDVVGLLGMDIPHLQRGHIVAVDEFGVIDPADNAPEHIHIADYVGNRLQDGVMFHTEWLAVRKAQAGSRLQLSDPTEAPPMKGALS